jgi:hypothetical protein
LDLHRFDGGNGDPSDAGRRVREGALACAACRVWYPVDSYVPVLLDFETEFHRLFAARHARELEQLAGYGRDVRPGDVHR